MRLRKQHQWGDLTDGDYRAERREIEAAVATLPAKATDTLVAFDEARARLLSMPEALAAASPKRRAEIVGLLVERISATRQTGMTGLEWTAPAARPSAGLCCQSGPCGIRTHDTRIKSPLL